MNEDFKWTDELVKEFSAKQAVEAVFNFDSAKRISLEDFKKSKQKKLTTDDIVVGIEIEYQTNYNWSRLGFRAKVKIVDRVANLITLDDGVSYAIDAFIENIKNGNLKIISKQKPLDTKEGFKEPLFTTEDGKIIYEGDNVCLLGTDYWLTSYPIRACKNPFQGDKNQFKYFSTKEAAEKYISEKKPILSYNDIKGLVLYDDVENGLFTIEIQRLKSFIKNKLK